MNEQGGTFPTPGNGAASAKSDRPPAAIITFYSYKGGTGRSMALANVAWILASNAMRVLVVDWDLEAPGLHRYFAPFLHDPDVKESDGVIDFITDFAVEAMTPGPEFADAVDRPEAAERSDFADGAATPNERWFEPLADISRYAVPLDYPFPGSGTLDFVPAGRA